MAAAAADSYDDLDKSHTEDLSSSEILDILLSWATDLGEPERSSSKEMLNNFHETNSPIVVSPNQPHPVQQPRGLTNGSTHPPPHYVHGGHPQPPFHAGVPPSMSGGAPYSLSFQRLPGGATVVHFHAGAASAGGAVASAASGRARQVGKTLTNLAAAGKGMTLPGGNHPGMFLSSHAVGKCARSNVFPAIENCFSHGQLYVACSRVGKPDNLYIWTDNVTTKNIVYPQAL